MCCQAIRKRKARNETHFAQVVRLLKFWAKLRKQEDSGFRFKSFMLELLVAHLADRGTKINDYPDALRACFNYLAADGLKSVIAFSDYYDPADCAASTEPVRIWDPVNCENNVAALYTSDNRNKIVDAAVDAGDAIAAALRATTKGDTVRYWQKMFGPTFNV